MASSEISIFKRAVNFLLPKSDVLYQGGMVRSNNLPMIAENAKQPYQYIMPLQMQRLTHDLSMWRNAIKVAENAWLPSRYYMQIMFVDTILEGHVKACICRRKKLTTLKQFVICDPKGNVDENLTSIICSKKWFKTVNSYILDAQFYGYSLIQLGDLVIQGKDYRFNQVLCLKRVNVEPDRQNLVSIPLQKTGINFLDPTLVDENGVSWYDWTIYVDTPSEVGQSICGYGLLYEVALNAIFLKNNLSQNADFNEKYGTPYRHIKTEGELEEETRGKLEESAINFGANGWIITPDNVNIEFITAAGAGKGFETFDNFEGRLQKGITKIFFGHEDAMSSTPGKLGGGQGNGDEDSSPVAQAIAETEKEQTDFLLTEWNDTVLPKLRKMGFPIPEGYSLGVSNDKEEFKARQKNDEANLKTALVFKTSKEAGLKLKPEQFTEITGLEAEELVEQKAPIQTGLSKAVKAKLESIYDFKF